MASLISLLGSFQPSSGRNHLIAFTLGLLITFLGIRANTRLIRANVRWWFHDIKPGGLHIHHMVIGVVVMVIAGLVTIATNPHGFWGIATALAFGGGVALTLDEFALLLHLENVYWQDQGRVSVDAVIVTVAAALLFLGGLQPFNVAGASPLGRLGGWVITVLVVINVTLAVVCFLKGKLWTGLLGCFVPVVATVGALRLARPGSPWSRRYRDNPAKRERAERRDRREAAMVRAWRVSFFDLIAGKPHIPHLPREADLLDVPLVADTGVGHERFADGAGAMQPAPEAPHARLSHRQVVQLARTARADQAAAGRVTQRV